MLKPATCRKYITLVRSNVHNVNPNIVEVHKCLVSNSFDLCLKYGNNLRPGTCRY